MTNFYLAALALTALALILLLRPLLRRSSPESTGADAESTIAINVAVHRDRLSELERDHAAGLLNAADLELSRTELQRQLLDDTRPAGLDDVDAPNQGGHAGKSQVSQPDSSSPRKLIAGIVLFVTVLSFGLYAWLGKPEAMLSPEENARLAMGKIEKMVSGLAAKMAQSPTPEGLAMLARSYKSLGRYDEAEKTYERIGPELARNPALMAEFAEALVQKNRSFEGRPRELLQKALQLDPGNGLALFLAGTDAIEGRRYAEAVTHWEKLLPQLEPGSEDARMIEGALATARERSGKSPGKGNSASTGKSAAGKPGPENIDKVKAGKEAISGRVELAPALAATIKPGDVVFVFARAVNGPRMPLAALRTRAADLPVDFSLDDQQALDPQLKISGAQEIRIEARVSRSGNATAAKGDLAGQSQVVKPGSKDVRVLIDHTIN